MNLLFGSISTKPIEFGKFAETVSLRFGREPRISGSNPKGFIGALSQPNQPIVAEAKAQQNNVTVALIGAVNRFGGGGIKFDAKADAELALSLYQENGVAGLASLSGQFLIAVLDESAHTLHLVSDPNNMRTVYYDASGDALHFCTNLGSLAACVRPPPERDFENFFLSHGFFPFNRTPYDSIRALPPGHCLTWKNGESSLTKLSTPNPWADRLARSNFEDCSEAEVIEALHEAFVEATRDQLGESSRVGVLLGGFDSALVAAYLQRCGREVHTYSFFYEDKRFNQAHTDAVAKHLGCQHHWVPVGPDVIKQGLKDFDRSFNAPTNWLNYVIQTQEVCRQIREDGIRDVYSGDGCDAAFLGYPRVHTTAEIFKALGTWPRPVVQALTKAADIAWLENVLGRPYTVALHLARTMARKMPERGFLTFRVFDRNSVRHMKGEAYVEASRNDEEILTEIAAPLKGKSSDRVAYGGKGHLSPNRSKIIGSSDSTGVVIQAPYLHPGFKALALSLPDRLCRPVGDAKTSETGKYILMKMAEAKNMLPPEVIYQRKFAAVDAPVDQWLKHDLESSCKEFLRDLPFTMDSRFRDSLFRDKLPEKIHQRFIASDSLTTHGLSLLLTYSRFTQHCQRA